MTAPPLHPPAERAPRRTIGSALEGRDNALNFVRLVLASAVIVGHSWPLGGFETEHGGRIGELAVNGFFVISGYLIAGSRIRTGFAAYLWRRALRILPAFWVCLVVVAYGFAPLGAVLAEESWSAASAVQYVLGNSALWITQWGVEGTLQSTPLPEAWNGSLWTLAYEFMAYLAAGVLLSLPWARRTPVVWISAALVAVLLLQMIARGPLDITTNLYLSGLRLAGFFLAGMLVWALRERLPASAVLGIACAVAAAAGVILLPQAMADSVTALPMAYLFLWLGGVLPVRIGAVNDVSYGVYIYAFPVQQLLAVAGVPVLLGFWGYAALAWILTLPLAWLSWQFVEKPAMRMKDLVRNSRSRSRSYVA